MNQIPEGYYDGEIIGAWIEAHTQDELEAVLCFHVRLGDESEITCRHRTGGDYPQIAQDVAELLELDYPEGLHQIGSTAGKAVRVKVKHRQSGARTYVNGYIVTNKAGDRPETDQVARMIERLKAKTSDDNIPF